MPLVVTKSEERLKPVILYENAKALWITLADRAANWTPWSKKSESGEVNDMAGEVIQAIIAPIGNDLEELRKILGEEQWKLLTTEKAEKHDDCVKYVQADEKRFEDLQASQVTESGIKLLYGKLRESKNAVKAESEALIPFPAASGMPPEYGQTTSRSQESFSSQLWRKSSALRDAITTAIELGGNDWGKIGTQCNDAVDAFDEWLATALDRLEEATGTVSGQKSDPEPENEPEKRRLWAKFNDWFKGQNKKPQVTAEKADKTHTIGENTMPEFTEDQLKEFAANVAAQTVQQMVEKAESEEARKADDERLAAEKADKETEKADLKAKLDAIEAKLGELTAQKSETTKTEIPDELAEAKATIATLQEQLGSLSEKMDRLQRTPGVPSSPEDKTKSKPKKWQPKQTAAQKSDENDPYSAFDDMLIEKG